MKPEVKRLIKDYLKRWRWAWVLLSLIHFASALAYASMEPGSAHQRLSIVGASMGALLLSFELLRAPLAAMLTLPVTMRDIGQMLWWLCLGLPAIMMTVLNLLALGIASIFLDRTMPLEIVAVWLLCAWGVLGVYYFSLTILPVSAAQQSSSNLKSALAGGIWGLSMPAMMFGIPPSGPWMIFAVIVSLFGLVAAVQLYAHPEPFICHRLQRGGATAPQPEVGRLTAPRRGFHGWKNLFWLHLRQSLWLSFIFFGVFFMVFSFNSGRFRVDYHAMFPMLIVGSVVMSIPWYGAVRVFRALPVPAGRLAFVFAVLPGVPTAISLGIIWLLAWLDSGSDIAALLNASLLVPALQSLVAPVILRWGGKPLVQFLIFFAVMMFIGVGMVWIRNQELSLLMLSLIAVVVATISFLWSRHELRAGKQTYQARPPFQGWGAASAR